MSDHFRRCVHANGRKPVCLQLNRRSAGSTAKIKHMATGRQSGHEPLQKRPRFVFDKFRGIFGGAGVVNAKCFGVAYGVGSSAGTDPGFFVQRKLRRVIKDQSGGGVAQDARDLEFDVLTRGFPGDEVFMRWGVLEMGSL